MKLSGDRPLLANLKAQSQGPTMRELDGACEYALVPLRDETNQRAPRPSLKGTAVIRKVKSESRFRRVFWVSFVGMGRRVAHLVELGTAPHSLAKGASRRKNLLQDVPPFSPGTAPEPFMRPAFEGSKDAVFRRMGDALWKIVTSKIAGLK